MPDLSAARVVRFGVFELDVTAGELHKDGRRVRIQEKPLQALWALVERPGEVVTREELCRRLWSVDTFVDFDNALNTAINKARVALGDVADNPRFVETVGRRGYRFIAPVDAAGSAARSPSPAGPRRRWIVLGLGAALLLVLLVWPLRDTWRARRTPEGVARPIESLAVLPLENLSGDPEQEYFADGMTDALITNLARYGTLRVGSRQSAMRFQGTRKPLPEIAAELNVDAVVEGSVLREGRRIRISAQLVDGRTDRHIWAQSYERDVGDVLALQGEVASDIAREVRIKTTPQEGARVTAPRPVRFETYEAYLKGRYLCEKRTREGFEKGIAYLTTVIQTDPGFAPAHATLAEAYGLLGSLGVLAPGEAFGRGRTAALEAVRLDETLGRGHAALAWIAFLFEWDRARAAREFDRALDLDPGDAMTRSWYALFLAESGRPAEALAMVQRAEQLDPLSLTVRGRVGLVLYLDRRYDEAIERQRQTLELDPGFAVAHLWLARAYLAKGLSARAIEEFEKAGSLGEGSSQAAELAHALAVSGRVADARRIFTELQRQGARRYVSPYDLALVHTGLGEKEPAFQALSAALQERSAGLRMLQTDPRLDPLRSDPRFSEFLRRLGV
jgi:TolB-like protein/DNA-binding winged helix-turn-helix (wHTH) protein/tetratricopeptide (TPR) repeat protein